MPKPRAVKSIPPRSEWPTLHAMYGKDVDAIRNLIHRGILLMRQQLPTTLAVERCEWLRDAEEICKKLER